MNDTTTKVHVSNTFGFEPGMLISIGGEFKPRSFWRRLWWHARKNIGGPKLFLEPRRDPERAVIVQISSTTMVLDRSFEPNGNLQAEGT